MIKQFLFPALLAAFLLSACGEEKTTGGPVTDTTKKNDSVKQMSAGSQPVKISPYDTTSFADGDVLMRYPNGVIKTSGTKKGGKRVGIWRVFHENGKLWSEGAYTDGMRNGKGVTFFENGKKSSEGSYKDDKFIGVWTYWDSAGNVAGKFDYGDGTTAPKKLQ